MKHSEDTLKGLNDFDLTYQAWLPDKEPHTVLIVVHGLAEHIGRYQNLVNYFVPKGYAVYGFDQRGHGKSPGLKGYVENFSYFIDDLQTFLNLVKSKNASKKIFLVGHSMGGLIATYYALKYQNELAGLILSGATLKVGSSISPLTIVAARILSAIAPKMGVATLDASAISRDKMVVDAYIHDPLVYRGKTRARLAAGLLNAILDLPKKMSVISLPILIMHGSNDHLSNPTGSHLLYEKVSSKDKTIKIYEGLHHEIFNEPEHEKVMADMDTWLKNHI